jgi:putative DNA primase/helicase
MMRPLENLLEHLDGVRPAGDGYVARCPNPGHGKGRSDLDPSLSVTEGDDGRALLKCHAQCPTEEIVAALGLSMSHLFERRDGNGSKDPKKICETYDYTDEACNLLFQSVRFEPKSLRQ